MCHRVSALVTFVSVKAFNCQKTDNHHEFNYTISYMLSELSYNENFSRSYTCSNKLSQFKLCIGDVLNLKLWIYNNTTLQHNQHNSRKQKHHRHVG